jgi:hypothetical protein
MTGVYQHCSEKHLQRYLNEFDFRYNHRAGLEIEDTMRADAAIRGIANKRVIARLTTGRTGRDRSGSRQRPSPNVRTCERRNEMFHGLNHLCLTLWIHCRFIDSVPVWYYILPVGSHASDS